MTPTRVRLESNKWIRRHACDIRGPVLSIGSGTDEDGEGGKYRDYFKACSSYQTSELTAAHGCDLVLDVRSMPQIITESISCIFCSAVLEHVDDYMAGLREMTRVLKLGGILLLGLPLRYEIHPAPDDYWRFTESGIRYMLDGCRYEILDLTPIDLSIPTFPVGYWVKARKT